MNQCPARDVQGLRCYLERDHESLHRSNDGVTRWAWAIDHGPEPLKLISDIEGLQAKVEKVYEDALESGRRWLDSESSGLGSES